ncbi:MAG: leucine-rich repeat protein [Lachnospiraceae bacterium]|nr:leucine-rich repeat protein [Lachnospiraceae bacterium]
MKAIAKNYVLAIMGLIAITLTACGNEEVSNKETNKQIEKVTEQFTHMPNSIIGKWYQCNDGERLNIWEFSANGEYYYDREEMFGKEDETYHILREKYSIEGNSITMDGREAIIEYTDYGLYIKEVDSEYELKLYEYRQDALESSDKYWTSDKYYETLKDENGCVIEDGVLIRYFTNDKEIVIPDNVTGVGGFVIASELEEIDKLTIPGNVKEIGASAFCEVPLGVVIIEEGVEEIGESAFEDSYFDEIHIPSSVKTISDDAFRSTEGNHGSMIYVKKGSYAEEYFNEYLNEDDYDGAEIIVEK